MQSIQWRWSYIPFIWECHTVHEIEGGVHTVHLFRVVVVVIQSTIHPLECHMVHSPSSGGVILLYTVLPLGSYSSFNGEVFLSEDMKQGVQGNAVISGQWSIIALQYTCWEFIAHNIPGRGLLSITDLVYTYFILHCTFSLPTGGLLIYYLPVRGTSSIIILLYACWQYIFH